MTIPINDKDVTIEPYINCTTLENNIFKFHHYPCKLAQTIFVDNDWSDKDANYTYFFEDWTDYDWNDIVISLYAITNDIIEAEIHLEDREADWKNPFGVEITPGNMNVEVHWDSTDYPGDHIVKVNSGETVHIELFAESNPGDTVFITIIPLISPTASFVYSPLQPEEGQTITFDASASTPNVGTIISYNWKFGNGKLGTGKIITNAYAVAGTYTVTLNVTNSVGKWDTESKQITVKPKPPPPPPVGGHAVPIDITTPHTLAPQISLALAFVATMTVTIILIRCENKKLKGKY